MRIEDKNDFLKVKDIELEADIKKVFDNGFYLGNILFKVGNIQSEGLDLPFTLKDAKCKMLVDIKQNKDETVNLDFKIDADAGASNLPTAYAFLQRVETSYTLHGMKLEGLLAFQDYTKKLQAQQQDILSRLQSPTTGELDMDVYAELQKMQSKTKDDMQLLMIDMLKKDSTSLSFETKFLDKNNKKSNFSMNMGYVGDVVFQKDIKALEAQLKEEWPNLITFDFDVKLEKDYISNLPAELQQELSGQLQVGKMFGIIKENNNSFSFDANYKPGILKVNGENKTEMLQMLGVNSSK